jgi:hypothetical protein
MQVTVQADIKPRQVCDALDLVQYLLNGNEVSNVGPLEFGSRSK